MTKTKQNLFIAMLAAALPFAGVELSNLLIARFGSEARFVEGMYAGGGENSYLFLLGALLLSELVVLAFSWWAYTKQNPYSLLLLLGFLGPVGGGLLGLFMLESFGAGSLFMDGGGGTTLPGWGVVFLFVALGCAPSLWLGFRGVTKPSLERIFGGLSVVWGGLCLLLLQAMGSMR